MIINSILASDIDSRSLASCRMYYPMLRLNGIATYPKVISPGPISTSARGYTHLFIRKCKHLRAHTTRCVHKLCISTCAQCFIRASANQAAFRQDQNWSAGGDVGYTTWLGLTVHFAHLSKWFVPSLKVTAEGSLYFLLFFWSENKEARRYSPN